MARKPRSNRVPAALASEIATTADGRDITRPWVADLQQARDPKLMRSVDWGVYDRIRKDDQVKSCMEQRIGAVVSREWDVIAGDDNDLRSVEAADRFKANLQRVSWDRVTAKMLWANFNGIAIGEPIYEHRDGLIQFKDIKVRHARRFRFDKDGRLRLLTTKNMRGELLPDRKFWVVTAGATDDDEPYGEGLADWLYWPTLFKRNGIKFWNIFLDKFGSPTAKGTYRRNTPPGDVKKLLQTLQAMATDSGFVVPEGVVVEFMEAARSGTASYEQLCRYMDEAITKIILSQTMTTQDGASLSQAKVHQGVKLEIVTADADLLSDSFNNGPARWWTDLNYGPDVAAPEVIRVLEEEEDLGEAADTDGKLEKLGWIRTDESFRDTYGDGYERKKPENTETDAPGTEPKPPVPPGAGAEADEKEPEPDSFAAQDPRPLYVYRPLLNADELIAWAKDQGFASTLPVGDMHVTVTYSRRPVPWMKMGGHWGYMGSEDDKHVVPPGGPRLVDRLGRDGAIVLHFFSGHLEHRHREMIEAGATWDFPEYLTHVTITYDAGDIDLAKVEPYRGRLEFGPEIFEPIEEDWAERIREASLAEPDRAIEGDDIDGIVDRLITDAGWAPIDPIMTPIAEAISRSRDVAELEAELIAALDQAGADRLVETIARAGFAVRLNAELEGEAPND